MTDCKEIPGILIDGRNVEDLIPHEAPMLMVDKLLKYESDWVETCFKIPQGCVLSESGFFSEAGIIENIAQSATISIGFDYYMALKEKSIAYAPPLGYIGAVNRFSVRTLPKVGDVIITRVKVLLKMAEVTVVKAEVFTSGEQIAEAEMKVFIAPPQAS